MKIKKERGVENLVNRNLFFFLLKLIIDFVKPSTLTLKVKTRTAQYILRYFVLFVTAHI